MSGTYLDRQARRADRRILLINVPMMLLVGLLGYVSWRTVLAAALGPYPLDVPAMAQDPNHLPGIGDLVQAHFENFIPTGVRQIEETEDQETHHITRREVGDYLAVNVGSRLLLTMVPHAQRPVEITGRIAPVSMELYEQVRKDFESAGAKDVQLFPVLVDGTDASRTAPLVWAAIGIVCFAVCSRNLWRWWARRRSPADSCVRAALAKYGDPEVVAASINAEYEATRAKGRVYGDYALLPSWFIVEGFLRPEIRHVSEIVWIYKVAVRRSVNFIPVGTEYSIAVHDIDGRKQTILTGVRERVINDWLLRFADAIPWAFVGYSKEVEEIYVRSPSALRGRTHDSAGSSPSGGTIYCGPATSTSDVSAAAP